MITQSRPARHHILFLRELTTRLEEDHGREFPIDIIYRFKNTGDLTTPTRHSVVVQPRWRVYDSQRSSLFRKKQVFVAGDGNVDGSWSSLILQRMGFSKEHPWDCNGFGYVHNIDSSYFPEGSQSRDFLRDECMEWIITHRGKDIVTS